MKKELRLYTREEFRFSGSYISRYIACPGSAVLAEAIPGFTAVERERKLLANGKLGTTGQATTKGTRLHLVFQQILEGEELIPESIELLRELAGVFGKNRTALLKNKKEYITWWFLSLKKFEEPPVEYDIIKQLHEVIPAFVNDDGDEINEEDVVTSPAAIRFLADALQYVYNLLAELEDPHVYFEDSRRATWTQTKPWTTADVVITDGKTLHIIDFKTGSLFVEVAYNPQLMYYAKTYRTTEDTLALHILQPKNIARWGLTLDILDEWVEQVLKSEQAILEGDRSLHPGSHCQFCPANPFSKGDIGSPKCPAQMAVLFGAEDLSVVTEEDE